MRQHRRGSGTFGSSLWLAAAAAIACFAAMAALRIMELNPLLPMGLGGDTGRPWRSSASFGTVNKKITQTSHKSRKKSKRTSMLPPVWIKLLLHFRVGPSLYVILKRAFHKLEDIRQLLLSPYEGHLEQIQTNRLAPMSPKGEPLGPTWLAENIQFIGVPPLRWADHRWSGAPEIMC